jgi:hypothetical protein
MHETHQRGAVAEAAITLAAIRVGIDVFKPASDGERYDLIFDLRPGSSVSNVRPRASPATSSSSAAARVAERAPGS